MCVPDKVKDVALKLFLLLSFSSYILIESLHRYFCSIIFRVLDYILLKLFCHLKNIPEKIKTNTSLSIL